MASAAPLTGPPARLLGQATRRAENRAETMQAQLARVLRRMALLEAGFAVNEVQGSQVLTNFFKADSRGGLERALRRILQDTGSTAFASAARRTARTRSAMITDERMREFMATKEVRLQQIMQSVRRDVRAAVRLVIAEAIQEVPRPSTGEIARRIRTTFAGPPVGGQVEEIVPAPRVGARVLPTERFRLTGGGNLYAFSSERAALIARTEMAQAENEGIVEGYRQTGVKGLKWLAYQDDRSGDRRHDKMRGQVTRMGEPFVLPTGRGRHYPARTIRWPGDSRAPISETANCFPGETAVRASGVYAAYRRRYDGELITLLTEDGDTATCTPNHPVLTRRGWVPAHDVTIGDDQVCRFAKKRQIGGVPGPGNVEAGPSSLAEIFEAMPFCAPADHAMSFDFHGDGGGRNVDVVWANGPLLNAWYPEVSQHIAEFIFSSADKAHSLLSCLSAFSEILFAPLHPSDRVMSPLRQGAAFARASIGHALIHRLRLVPGLNPSFVQATSDTAPRECERLREGFLTFAGQIASDNLRALDRFPEAAKLDVSTFEDPVNGFFPDAETLSYASARLSGQVAFHNVARKSVVYSSGHVYNIGTESGWYTTASGTIFQNCRCSVAPVLLDEDFD